MIDKKLLSLLGENKKYIFYTVGMMVLGLFANVGITASICWALHIAIHYSKHSGGVDVFLWPGICAADPCVHHCRVQIRKKDICKILGQIHFHGRFVSGQRTGIERIENFRG